jgi:hypothetical protein
MYKTTRLYKMYKKPEYHQSVGKKQDRHSEVFCMVLNGTRKEKEL